MSALDESRWAEARRWFAIASEDLRVARASLGLQEPALGAAAYHSQQAAEKLMKGGPTAEEIALALGKVEALAAAVEALGSEPTGKR